MAGTVLEVGIVATFKSNEREGVYICVYCEQWWVEQCDCKLLNNNQNLTVVSIEVGVTSELQKKWFGG